MAMTLVERIEQARRQLGQLTGLELGSTVSVRKDEDRWKLRVEVVEKKSMPDSQDLLATYDLAVDEAGQVVDFSRIGMRRRMDPVAAAANDE